MKNYETGFREHIYRYRKMFELSISALGKSYLFTRNIQKSLKPVPQEVVAAYENYKADISLLYGKDSFDQNYLFHGTGRYQYQFDRGHKYNGSVTESITDVLSTVLISGLQPKPDIWVPTPASLPTVSLTHQRFYARWYADKHNTDDLLWHYGESTDWASLFVISNITQWQDIIYVAFLLRPLTKNTTGGLLGAAHRWVGDARNDISTKTSYTEALRSRSTIPNNYGTIFASKEDCVLTYDFPLLRRTEKRSLTPIHPESISIVEAPLKHIAEVDSLLEEYQIGWIKTLPIECVDYHLSRFPLEELTRVDTFTEPQKMDPKYIDSAELDFGPINCDDLRRLLSIPNYSPQRLLELLRTAPFLDSLLTQQCSWEGFSIYYHTLSGLHLFEEFFTKPDVLPEPVTRDFFKVFFALHDIGDSLGKNTAEKLAYNQLICVQFLIHLGFSHQEILIAQALLSDDPVGSYLKKVGTAAEVLSHAPTWIQLHLHELFINHVERLALEARNTIKLMADMAQMSYPDFLQLIIVFHMVDAGSYTSQGGTVGSLNYVFEFDLDNRDMTYASKIQQLMSYL